jgi:tRNA threonylcarbamoyladenosine biosynthesis protein TsaB
MILKIDTSKKEIIEISIEKDGDILFSKKKKAEYNQAEILLPLIKKILEKQGIKLSEIKKIKVNNKGDSFTSLRIGIITANALAFALDIELEDFNGKNTSFNQNKEKISLVRPEYSKEPSITIK